MFNLTKYSCYKCYQKYFPSLTIIWWLKFFYKLLFFHSFYFFIILYQGPSPKSILYELIFSFRDYEYKLNTTRNNFIENLCSNDNSSSTPLLISFGSLINLNSLDSFKAYDKNKLLEEYGEALKKDIVNGEALKNPQLLNRFILLTFAVSLINISLLPKLVNLWK